VKSGEIERARALLDEWRGASGVVRSREEVIRLAIEEALISSHRHVFGVIFWYVLLPGPSGAILYRIAAYLYYRWKDLGGFGRFAQRAFELLEWPAVRLTAASFAVVGDFEDAIYCWRTQARMWGDPNEGVILGAGAGAMGVRLGMPVQEVEGMQPRSELGVGEVADGPFLDSTVGLVWRALVVWIFVLALVTVARVF
jgi:adenosylcobinamide-phosphate synthase